MLPNLILIAHLVANDTCCTFGCSDTHLVAVIHVAHLVAVIHVAHFGGSDICSKHGSMLSTWW